MNIKESINVVLKKYGLVAKDIVQMMVEATLTDGTKVASPADELAVGAELFVIVEGEEPSPAPDGNHTLEDGRTVTTESGIITAIEEVVEQSAERTFTRDEVKTIIDEVGNAYKDAVEKLNAQVAELTQANKDLKASKDKQEDDMAELKAKVEKLSTAKPQSVTRKSENKVTSELKQGMSTRERARAIINNK